MRFSTARVLGLYARYLEEMDLLALLRKTPPGLENVLGEVFSVRSQFFHHHIPYILISGFDGLILSRWIFHTKIQTTSPWPAKYLDI